MTTLTDAVMNQASALLVDLDEHQRRCFVQVLGTCPTCNAVPVVRALYDDAAGRTTLTPVEADVRAERARQHAMHGEQNLPDIDPHDIPEAVRGVYAERADRWKEINAQRYESGCGVRSRQPDVRCTAWDGILLEEVYEALAEDSRTDAGELRMRAELVQAAAVVVQQIEAIDRRRARRAALVTIEEAEG